MRAKLAPELQMTVEEFLAFTDSRSDEERWELIEGRPVMNPSPTNFHQLITTNVVAALVRLKLENDALWLPLIGIGTRVPASANSLPQPDVLVLERPPGAEPSPVTDDALVLFEVLSESNTKADQAWRRRVYASVPNCRHYVTVSQNEIGVTRYDRSSQWEPATMKRLKEVLALPALGVKIAIPLAEIYRWTPLGNAD